MTTAVGLTSHACCMHACMQCSTSQQQQQSTAPPRTPTVHTLAGRSVQSVYMHACSSGPMQLKFHSCYMVAYYTKTVASQILYGRGVVAQRLCYLVLIYNHNSHKCMVNFRFTVYQGVSQTCGIESLHKGKEAACYIFCPITVSHTYIYIIIIIYTIYKQVPYVHACVRIMGSSIRDRQDAEAT